MKKLFFAAIPICLVSFVLFGISVMCMGTKSYSTPGNSSIYEGSHSSGKEYINQTLIASSGEWTITDTLPNVTLRTAGVNAYVIQSADESIHVNVNSPAGNKVKVSVYNNSGEMVFEIHPPEITFDNIVNFDVISWLDDIFHDNSDIQAVIAFPKRIYDSLNIQHGSGTLMVDGFNASTNTIDIGSGRFEFSKSEKYTADHFSVNLGSGRAVIANMQTNSYKLDIGSGSFDFSGLTGSGEIDMGSGNGSIAYASNAENDYPYGYIDGYLDMGSGNLTVYFPDEGSLEVSADIGSGSVDIDAFDLKRILRISDSGKSVKLGNSDGESFFNIDMGSGKVNIRNTSAYTAPEMFEGRPSNVDELGAVAGIVIGPNGVQIDNVGQFTETNNSSSSSSVNAADDPENGASTGDSTVNDISEISASGPASSSSHSSIPEVPEAPDAPEPPEAPTAPEAPEAPTI